MVCTSGARSKRYVSLEMRSLEFICVFLDKENLQIGRLEVRKCIVMLKFGFKWYHTSSIPEIFMCLHF